MNKSKGLLTIFSKHSPEILTGVGIAGMITTVVMAVRATPKAIRLIEQAKIEKNPTVGQGSESVDSELTILETIKTTWLCYIPSIITGSLSIFCLISASSVNTRRNAALTTAYTLSDSALKEYRQKVIETVGDKKEQTIRDAVAKEKIDRDPFSDNEVILTEKGNTLCYDVISGRYFKSDIDKIKKAVNEINRNLLDEMYVSLNDFFYEIGLSNTKLGDDLGWNIDNGLIDLNFSSQLTDDGTPCLVIDYQAAPKYNYYK